MQTMLLTMGSFINLNRDREVDLSAVENRLAISLPKELKQIYRTVQNQEEYFTSAEHFLPLNEFM